MLPQHTLFEWLQQPPGAQLLRTHVCRAGTQPAQIRMKLSLMCLLASRRRTLKMAVEPPPGKEGKGHKVLRGFPGNTTVGSLRSWVTARRMEAWS